MTVTAIETVVDMEKALADARYRLLGEIEETVPDQEGPVYQVTSQNKELLGESYISDKDLRNIGKILLITAGADGEIAEEEMEYLLGFGQGMGAPDEMVAEWENFDWQNGKMEDHIAQLSNFGKPRRNRLLYTAIKVAWADEDYAQEEKEATGKIGELVGIDPVNVTAIEGLVKIERAIADVLHDLFIK